MIFIISNVELGKKVKDFRKLRRLSVQQLADMVDLSPNQISKVERGVNSLSLESFVKLMNVLDVSAEQLLNAEFHPLETKFCGASFESLQSSTFERIRLANVIIRAFVKELADF